MLSSRWDKVNLYQVYKKRRKLNIIATSAEEASKAFTEITGIENPDIYLHLREEEILVTEEAQAQSVLFPNGKS